MPTLWTELWTEGTQHLYSTVLNLRDFLFFEQIFHFLPFTLFDQGRHQLHESEDPSWFDMKCTRTDLSRMFSCDAHFTCSNVQRLRHCVASCCSVQATLTAV